MHILLESLPNVQDKKEGTLFGRKKTIDNGQKYLQQTMKNLQIIREIPDDITSISLSGNLMAASNSSGELYMASSESANPICIGRLNTSSKKIGMDYVGLENAIKILKWDFELNTIIETEQKYSNSGFGVFTIVRVSDSDFSTVRNPKKQVIT